MNNKPRDYRDPIDIDEQLDAIRVTDRAQALSLFRSCLDAAHLQGRMEGASEAAEIANKTIAATFAKWRNQ